MWIKASGNITPSTVMAVTSASSHFLFIGDYVSLVDTGIYSTADEIIDVVKDLVADPEEFKYIFLTHSDFDHVGALPALKKAYPNLQVVSGVSCAEALEKKENIKHIIARNKAVAKSFSKEVDISDADFAKALKVDQVLADGDSINLGDDVVVRLMTFPGHTIDTVGYYVPTERAIVAGEAVGGYFGREKVVPIFKHSLKAYCDSITKMTSLDVRLVGLPHGGAISGDLAVQFLVSAREEAQKFAATVKSRIDQGELVDEVARSIVVEWAANGIAPEGPFTEEREKGVLEMVRRITEA